MSKHVLQVGNVSIKMDKDEMVSLSDLFAAAKATGMASGKLEPRQWAMPPREKKSGTSGKVSISGGPGWQFIEFASKMLNRDAATVYKTVRGKQGGTYGDIQIALSYAKYLSPSLHYAVNETYLRAKSGDVTLADEIVDKAKPEDVQKHLIRTASKVTRNEFTSTLGRHGVRNAGYGQCTNAIYRPLLGGDATAVREQRNLPAKANVRESMSAQEIILTAHAEMFAARDIVATRANGNDDCINVCERAARRVASI